MDCDGVVLSADAAGLPQQSSRELKGNKRAADSVSGTQSSSPKRSKRGSNSAEIKQEERVGAAVSKENCPICCCPYTPQLRKAVQCPYCEKRCCIRCTTEDVLKNSLAPRCMFCMRGWTAEIIDGVFSKAFRRGELRRASMKNLLAQEKSLLPDTQLRLQDRDRRDKLDYLAQNNETLWHRVLRIPLGSNEDPLPLIQSALENRRKWEELNEQDKMFKSTREERRQFIRPCPAEKCRGFLSTAWKCGLCNTRVCSKCHEIKRDPPSAADADQKKNSSATGETVAQKTAHVCDPSNVASAAAIMAESKPCPTCGVRIVRIAGCPQMWCTACNSAFDWDTGRTVNGRIHNPHYDEWVNRNNVGAVLGVAAGPAFPQCDQEFRWQLSEWQSLKRKLLDKVLEPSGQSTPKLGSAEIQGNSAGTRPSGSPCSPTAAAGTCSSSDKISSACSDPLLQPGQAFRLCIEFVEHRGANAYSPNMYSYLRAMFLHGHINETEWLRALSIKETRRERESAVDAVRAMVVAACSDLFRRMNDATTRDQLLAIEREFSELRDYANRQLERVANDFTVTMVRQISGLWYWSAKPKTKSPTKAFTVSTVTTSTAATSTPVATS